MRMRLVLASAERERRGAQEEEEGKEEDLEVLLARWRDHVSPALRRTLGVEDIPGVLRKGKLLPPPGGPKCKPDELEAALRTMERYGVVGEKKKMKLKKKRN